MCAVSEDGKRIAAPADDAADLGWFTLKEMKDGKVPMGSKTPELVALCEGLVRAGVLDARAPSSEIDR